MIVSLQLASFQSSTYNWSAILVSGSNREKGILFGARQFTTLEGAKNYVGQIKEPNMVECLKTVLVGSDYREIDLDGLIEVLEVEGKYSVLIMLLQRCGWRENLRFMVT